MDAELQMSSSYNVHTHRMAPSPAELAQLYRLLSLDIKLYHTLWAAAHASAASTGAPQRRLQWPQDGEGPSQRMDMRMERSAQAWLEWPDGFVLPL